MAVYSGRGALAALQAQGYERGSSFRDLGQGVGFGNGLVARGNLKTYKVYDEGRGSESGRFTIFGRR